MIVSEQLNYIKTRRFHAIFMSVIIEFSRCIGTYSSAKFEYPSCVKSYIEAYREMWEDEDSSSTELFVEKEDKMF